RRTGSEQASVPQDGITGLPLEANGVLRTNDILPQEHEHLLPLSRCQAHDRLQEGWTYEQHPLAALGMHRDQRMLAHHATPPDTFIASVLRLARRGFEAVHAA